MAHFCFVPLRSITINRNGPVDALAVFEQTGLAVEFTPGEVEDITRRGKGRLKGWLREPTPAEHPRHPQGTDDEEIRVTPSDQGDEPHPSVDELNDRAAAYLAANPDPDAEE